MRSGNGSPTRFDVRTLLCSLLRSVAYTIHSAVSPASIPLSFESTASANPVTSFACGLDLLLTDEPEITNEIVSDLIASLRSKSNTKVCYWVNLESYKEDKKNGASLLELFGGFGLLPYEMVMRLVVTDPFMVIPRSLIPLVEPF